MFGLKWFNIEALARNMDFMHRDIRFYGAES